MVMIPNLLTAFVDALTKAEQGFNAFVRLEMYATLPAEDHPTHPRKPSHEDIIEAMLTAEDKIVKKPAVDGTEGEGEGEEGDTAFLDRVHKTLAKMEEEHPDEAWWTAQEKMYIDDYPLGLSWESEEGSVKPKMLEDFLRHDSKVPPLPIQFKNCVMRYRPALNPNMINVTFTVQPGDKVGVCGRTGAGKSTLFYGLFRLAELDSTRVKEDHRAHALLGAEDLEKDDKDPFVEVPGCPPEAGRWPEGALTLAEGGIFIGGEDISQFSLHDVRRAICIIPQEPSIFSGSIRRNLDPLGEFSEQECWEALSAAHLDHEVRMQAQGLDATAEGAFSVGQKQLLCLARAVLRKPKILVLDEVTANVDIETDHLIQETIKSKFPNCTQMAIAHRIGTIIDSDKILVMDQGRLAEFGHPHKLLENQAGIFSSLVNADKDNAKSLHLLAEQNWNGCEEKVLEELQSMPDGGEKNEILAKKREEFQQKMSAFQERQIAEYNQKIADAVPDTFRDSVKELSAAFDQLDKQYTAKPHDEMRRLQVQEMYNVLSTITQKLKSSHFVEQNYPLLHSDATESTFSTPRMTPMHGIASAGLAGLVANNSSGAAGANVSAGRVQEALDKDGSVAAAKPYGRSRLQSTQLDSTDPGRGRIGSAGTGRGRIPSGSVGVAAKATDEPNTTDGTKYI